MLWTFLSGPAGWIGLAIVLVGAALLTWVFMEDPPLEQWLKNGPFSQKAPPHLQRRPAATRTPGPDEEHERYVNPDDGSQLLLGPDKRILRIGSRNESFRQGPDGTIYQRQEDGSEIEVGRIGEPLDLNRLADRSTRFGGSFAVWNRKPKTAYYAIVSALYSPDAVLALHEVATGIWQARLTVDLPNFIEGRSRLYVEIERKRAGMFGNWKADNDYSISRLIMAEDAGSGPRTVKVPIPITYSEEVRVKIRLDLYGDGTHVLPADDNNWKKPKPIIRECGPAPMPDEFAYDYRVAP